MVVRYNRRATDLWGRESTLGDASARFCGSHKLYRTDGTPLPHDRCPMADVLRTGEAVRDAEAVDERPDGTGITAVVNIGPIRDAAGRVVGAVNVFQDATARRRAEAALRGSEAELADFFENASVGLHWVGPDGTILRANRAELEMLGYSREEYVGRHIAEFHADRDVIDDILRRLAAGETLRDCPARMVCTDGTIKHVLIDSSVLWADGRFVHTRCCTRDVTAQVRAAEALRESERRFRALASHAPVGIFQTDPQRQLPVRQRAAVYDGRDDAGPGAGARLGGWPAPRRPRPRCPRVVRAAKAGREFASEHRFRSPDGTVTWLSGSAVAVREEDGRVVGYIGTVTDVTRLRRAERELHTVTDAMSAPVTRCGRDLRYRWVSRSYADWLGRPIAEVLGAEAFAQLRPHYERVLSGEPVRYEEEVDVRGPGRR